MPYTPPLTITPRLIDPISRISLALGCWEGAAAGLSPNLRRKNHIRSIHALLAVENRFILEAWLESLGHAIRPDFYLPELDVYIEYWGMDTADYKIGMLKKQQLYQQEGKRLISIHPPDKPHLDTILHRKLALFGYTIHPA